MTIRQESLKKAHLSLFVSAYGHHVAAWRHPSVPSDAGHDVSHLRRVAQVAEAAKFDAVFFADVAAFNLPRESTEAAVYGARSGQFEPVTLLAALSAVTDRLGLICTASTTYSEPYQVARQFASLDHLSTGRAGWNLVTSANPNEAMNFGRSEHLEHGKRYDRAEEFIDVVMGLWDSWEDDAFIRDKATGQQFDPTKLHVLDHIGPEFRVRGPLNIARPPQGYPVRVQAGSSSRGQELAARTADLVFTVQQTVEGASAFYRELKARLPRYGRASTDLLIMPGLCPVVGRTQAEADAKMSMLQDLVHPKAGMALLSSLLGGFDLSHCGLDEPLPDVPLSNGSTSRQKLVVETARQEGLSLRQTYVRLAGTRGHLQVVGTPSQVVDLVEEWLEEEAADGFNVMPPLLPGGLDDFVALVLPELRRRGRFRTEYTGRTLRENLGLKRPAVRR